MTGNSDVYVVDSVNGNDSWTGLTKTSAQSGSNGPWKSLNKAQTGITLNDKTICLMTGSDFDLETITIGEDGTTLATCYEAEGGLWYWWEGPTPYTVSRAKVRGSWKWDCSQANPVTCDINNANAVPTVHGGNLVRITANRVLVRGIECNEAAGDCMAAAGPYEDVVFAQNYYFNNAFAAAWLINGVHGASGMFDNESYYNTSCEMAEQQGRLGSLVARNCGTGGKPACFNMSHNSPDTIPGGSYGYGMFAYNHNYQGACELYNPWDSPRQGAFMNHWVEQWSGVLL